MLSMSRVKGGVCPCGEHKLRNFKARYLTMKHAIREYSNLGTIAHLNSTKSC